MSARINSVEHLIVYRGRTIRHWTLPGTAVTWERPGVRDADEGL